MSASNLKYLLCIPISIFVGVCINECMEKYFFFKKYNEIEKKEKIYYNFDIFTKYNVMHRSGGRREYFYTVSNPTLCEMQSQYWESLNGNYKIKESVDRVLQDYINTYMPINQKFIIINRPEWSCKIENKSYSNDNYLVIDIMSDQTGTFRQVDV